MNTTTRITALVAVLVSLCSFAARAQDATWPQKTFYRYQEVNGHRIFYREAGSASAPTILLLHGFPTTSHAYRELIPLLSGRYHVIAPDYLGSGYSEKPDPASTAYTFDLLADHVNGLVEALHIQSYVLYMHDFGGPVGFRVMLSHPERLRGIVVQNANAYLEGLGTGREAFFHNAHDDRSKEMAAQLYERTSREAISKTQYLRDVKGHEEVMSPDTSASDLDFLQTDTERRIQVQLFQDYWSNIEAYPKWQAFMREKQPPALIVWGRNDPTFIAPGAEAFLRDLPKAEVHLLDTGHFAVEEKPVEIAQYITRFMGELPKS
jgi:pimeloyl-ACP methyl ester carboxylesterase